MVTGHAKASKLWEIYQGTSDLPGYMKRAKAAFRDDDGACMRAMWYAFDCANDALAPPKPRVRERLNVGPPRKVAARGRK